MPGGVTRLGAVDRRTFPRLRSVAVQPLPPVPVGLKLAMPKQLHHGLARTAIGPTPQPPLAACQARTTASSSMPAIRARSHERVSTSPPGLAPTSRQSSHRAGSSPRSAASDGNRRRCVRLPGIPSARHRPPLVDRYGRGGATGEPLCGPSTTHTTTHKGTAANPNGSPTSVQPAKTRRATREKLTPQPPLDGIRKAGLPLVGVELVGAAPRRETDPYLRF
jgi:hypothetical protein